jgi:hypothetical protein
VTCPYFKDMIKIIMLKNKIWMQTNVDQELLTDYALKQYEDSLDAMRPWIDFHELRKKPKDELLLIFETKIEDFVLEDLKNKNIDVEHLFHNDLDKTFISNIDCYKLFIISGLIYPFWAIPYDSLYEFYKSNKLENEYITVDLYIGRIKYLFNLDNGEFDLFESWLKIQDIKNS